MAEQRNERKRKQRIEGNPKIFCIGHNKTGTTSLKQAFKDLGYIVGRQSVAEEMLYDYRDRKFDAIVDYCHTAEVFQDIPFSLPYLFVHLDQEFPGSKFILSVRDSEDQWYQSITRFHSKKYKDGTLPTIDDLKEAEYRWKGFAYETKGIIYNTPDEDLYNKEKMTGFYNDHNAAVIEYFRYRPEDLLVINLSEPDAYQKFCAFIGKEPLYDEFPWENASK